MDVQNHIQCVMTVLGWPIVNLLFGAFIAWLVTRYYYVSAAKDLQSQSARLEKLSTSILRWLEAGGENVEVRRDEHGDVQGLTRTAEVVESAKSGGVTITGGELRRVHGDGDEPSGKVDDASSRNGKLP